MNELYNFEDVRDVLDTSLVLRAMTFSTTGKVFSTNKQNRIVILRNKSKYSKNMILIEIL